MKTIRELAQEAGKGALWGHDRPRDFMERFAALVRAQTLEEALPDGVVVFSYRVSNDGQMLRVERAQRGGQPDRWAVRSGFGECLNKAGDWEDEPSPSNRTEPFFERCRFDSVEDAISAIRALKASVPPDQETPKGV